MHSGHGPCGAVEVRDPDLRTAFFRGHKQEALAIGRPARPVGILVFNNLPGITSSNRDNPDMRCFGIRAEVHIHDAK